MMETGANKIILIIDDEKANVFYLNKVLSADYEILSALDGEKGIERANEFLPDLILLDLIIPGMDGSEVLTTLQGAEKTKDIPVIFITGLSGSDEESKGLSLGADDYISKPFNDEVVRLRVRNQLSITAQKQTERIRSENERMKALVDTAPLACHLWGRDIRPFDCNEEAVRLFKMKDKQDYLERFSMTSPEYQPDGSKSSDLRDFVINKAFQEGRCVFEWEHRASDGTPIPAEIILARVAFDDDYAVAGYVRDLREHKRMMEEIEKHQTLLDTMNEAANVLLLSESWEFDNNLNRCMGMIGETVKADRISIWKNRVKEGELCYSLVCEWVSDDSYKTPADMAVDVTYASSIPTWEKALSNGDCVVSLARDLSPIEQKRMGRNGIKSVFAVPVFVQNEFWGFVGCDNCHDETVFTGDVADTLRSGSLLIVNSLLRTEMTLNLQTAAAELEEALENTRHANDAKSDFLASMSHEMRTPLNAIIGLSGLSLEDSRIDEETSSNLQKIYSSGDMLLSIVNDILDISKIEAGRMDLIEVDYDVPSLINDTVTQNILRIGEKPIEFRLDITEDMFSKLHGDELRVKQIMNNLLSNAIKYTEKGTVNLSLACEREGDDVWVTVKVTDTGIGIRPEDIGKLYKDFAQLDVMSNRYKEGTGLGLPIVKNLVELMRGSVEVESEYGKGSVFTARLAQKFVSDVPIGIEVVRSLKSFRYSEKKRGRIALKRISLPYARVLVADDNLTNLDVSKGLMKPYGMQVDCVTGGRQAVEAIRNGVVRYDAVFMDHMMPDIDGIEATRIIREEIGTEYAENIPIIALTANALAGNETMFLSKGFQAFIPKPVEIARLDEVIRRWVRDKEKEKEFSADADEKIEATRKIFGDVIIPRLDIPQGIIRFGGDEETYLDSLRSYAENTGPLLEQIKNVSQDSLSDYAIIVHGIKGSSRGISAEAAGAMAAKLESAAKCGDYDFVEQNNMTLINIAYDLIDDINKLIGKVVDENPKPGKGKPDTKLLEKLLDACERFSADDVDDVIAKLDSYKYETGGDLIAELKKCANAFDFAGIKKKLLEDVLPPGKKRK